MWNNQYCSDPRCIIDTGDRELALRKELGFTHCIIGNNRRPMAWTHNYEAACKTTHQMIEKGWQPQLIVSLTMKD